MDDANAARLRIGDWCIDPLSSQMSRGTQVIHVEARTLRLMLCLAARPGETVGIDELLERAWAGVIVSPDSVYQAVASLRRLLGDDAKNPTYIVTVPRLGYRLVASVSPWVEPSPIPTAHVQRRTRVWLTASLGLVIALVVGFALVAVFADGHRIAPKSIGVLPFLDLTDQDMTQEYFADGMTEELIDRLSRIPSLRVPSPTASFYFKGKQESISAIAASLGVAYVLDGSVRKSSDTLRISARLVRADTGFVIWSETYDRPARDLLSIQDDIAGQVAKALAATL